VNNESTRKALYFSQTFKEQTLRKQIFSAILYLYLFSQLSARIFPKRGRGGIPPTPPFRRARAERSGQEFFSRLRLSASDGQAKWVRAMFRISHQTKNTRHAVGCFS